MSVKHLGIIFMTIGHRIENEGVKQFYYIPRVYKSQGATYKVKEQSKSLKNIKTESA